MRRRPLILGFATAAALLSAMGIGVLLWRTEIRRQIEAERIEWRNLGLPPTPAELDARYRRDPPAMNAADLYDEALAVLPRTEMPRSPSLPVTEEGEVLFLTRAALSNAAAVPLIKRAATLEEYYRPYDLHRPVLYTQFTHAVKMQGAAQALLSEGQLAALGGDGDTVDENLRSILAMARHMRSEPLLVVQLYSAGLVDQAIELIEYSLGTQAWSPDRLRAWSDALSSHGDPWDLGRGLLSDFVVDGLYYFSADPYELPWSTWTTKPSFSNWIRLRYHDLRAITGWTDFEQLKYLRFGREVLQAIHLPFPERRAAIEIVCREFYEGASWRSPITCFVCAYPPGSVDDYTEKLARIHCAVAGLAIERYTVERGRTPEGWTALTPHYMAEEPLDPFTGHPLGYQTNDAGCVVYSYGKNRRDDGGVEEIPWDPLRGAFPSPDDVFHSATGSPARVGQTLTGDDIVFRVERRAR